MLNRYIVEFTDVLLDSDFDYPNMSDIILAAESIVDAKVKFKEAHKNTEFHRFYIDNIELC